MKKSLFLIILIYVQIFAFEVHKTKEFSLEVEPTKMSTSIVANIYDADKINIQDIFHEAIEGSKREGICTNGSYRISPRYVYNKQVRTFVGYQGNITFTCEFEDSEKLDNVISHLNSLNNKQEILKLTINPILWIVQEEVVKEKNKVLELQALNFSKDYRKFLSDEYESTCKIQEVVLNPQNRPIHPMPRHALMSESKSRTTKPINTNHTLKFSAFYKFECE
ncbi:SIMPL domain-containing protein [Sulfurimonas sp.]|nr:SIMPL domain-containing protein [Sulfurimonas sp.]